MKIRWSRRAGALVLGACLAIALTASGQTAQTAQARKGAAATIGDQVITLAELEQLSAPELATLEEQRYRVLERKLGQVIADRLIGQEAKRLGISPEALVHAEVTLKTPPVTGDDVSAFIRQNRSRLQQTADEDDLKAKVADFLYRQQRNQRAEAYVAALRAKTTVQVYLTPPDPPRARVDPSVGFARGPREAPVTIVEFSDFQCPFCKNVVVTLKQVLAQYPERVRWVFRDYPIAGLHPEAQRGHEAARCAGDQGKFWPYHDLLFEQGPDVSPAALRQYAAQAGLDATAFGSCLESGKHRAAVNTDIEAGTQLGVTGTPTFFINGVPLVGNQPLAEFQRVIERELGRTAATR
jgi:protein-disulfide isomerase